MKATVTTCDRCGGTIISEGSVIEGTAGPIRRTLGHRPIDLCCRCVAAFKAWLTPPADAAIEGRAHVA